ncbi:MAG: hypothetical protein ACI4EK_03070 [Wujia sp.]
MGNVYEVCFYGGLILSIVFLIVAVVLFFVLKIPKVIGDLTGMTAKKTIRQMGNGAAATGNLSKKEQEKYYNMGTGKITVKDTYSTPDKRRETQNDSTELLNRDDVPSTQEFDKTDILRPGINDYEFGANADTEILSEKEDDAATDVLAGNDVGDDAATDVLVGNDVGSDDATDVLTSEDLGSDDATDVLTSEDVGSDDATDVLISDDAEVHTEYEESGSIYVEDDEEEGTSVLSGMTEEALAAKARVVYNIKIVHTDETLE